MAQKQEQAIRVTRDRQQRSRSRTPVVVPARRGVLDRRWLIAGGAILVIAVIIAVSVFATNQNTSTVASSSALGIGEVTEPSLGSTPPAPGILPVGAVAPNVQWTMNGQPGSIQALRGQPILLEYLATWCPHCQAETPIISRLAQRYASQGLQVIGITASPLGQDQRSQASVNDLQSFASKYGAQYPLILDRNLVGAQRYGVRSFPTLYIIDKNGVIRYATSGETPETDLAQQIETVLK